MTLERPLQARAEQLLKDITPVDTPKWKLVRYDHGGGRLYIDGEAGVRTLIADFYNEGDREFYSAAPQLVRELLTALADQAQAQARLTKEATRVDHTQYDPPPARPLATAASNQPVPTCVTRTCPHGFLIAACCVDEETSVKEAERWVDGGKRGGIIAKVTGTVQMQWCDICCGPPFSAGGNPLPSIDAVAKGDAYCESSPRASGACSSADLSALTAHAGSQEP